MADISDITAYLLAQATLAVYPNGTGQPSVAGIDVRMGEGWPNPNLLDLDIAGTTTDNSPTGAPIPRPGGVCANVTVFPMLGTNNIPYQIQDDVQIIVPPVFGMAATIVNGVINVTGAPNAGEYLTVVADGLYVHSEGGATTAAILAALATDFSANYAGVSSTATTLTIPFGHSLVVRIGAIGTLGKVTHRQRQSVMITVWAPSPASRTTLAKAIDVALKASSLKVTLPDTSQAVITYDRTNVIDEQLAATIYRRDLIYCAEYATLQTFPGYVITTVNVTIASPTGAALATALT